MSFTATEIYGQQMTHFVPVDRVALDVNQVRLAPSQVTLCGSDTDPFEFGDRSLVGHEVGGTIIEVGPGVTGWAVGDRVAAQAWPGLAEEVVVDAGLLVDAEGLPDPAIVEPLGCVINVLRRTGLRPGSDVVVVGATKSMGYLLTRLIASRYEPRTLVATGRRPGALANVEALGATVVNTNRESLSAVVEDVTEGRWPDVIFECTGVQGGLDLAHATIKRPFDRDKQRPNEHSTIVWVGWHLSSGGDRRLPLGVLNPNETRIVNAHFRNAEDVRSAMDAGANMIRRGEIDLTGFITHRFGFSDQDVQRA
ncbi:MAG: alcohol dehydrogenase catalytic domain-containing protein, partial [Actinomycetes bacterium]